MEPSNGPLPISAYVILGMLNLGQRTGYEIKQAVNRSTRYFSTISDAQIYPLLKQLEADGLVSGRSEPRGRRPRRIYQLMPSGEAALREWLTRDEELLLDVWDIGLLKLFFADALGTEEALGLVRSIRARSERILRELRERSEPAGEQTDRRGDRFPLRVLPFGIAMHRAWVDVCERLEDELRAQAQARAPEPGRRP